MDVQSIPNPIGVIRELPEFTEKIKSLTKIWDEKISSISSNWINNWGLKSKVGLSLATGFLLECLDELVVVIDKLIENGPDKKATVLSGLDNLYEYVMREALPIWLRPFASVVKQYIIYSLASYAIDYMVSKYKNGAWRKTGGLK